MAIELPTATLNPERLLSEAEEASRLSDWGGEAFFDSSFRKLFSAMAESLSTESRLTAAGAQGAEQRLRAMAESRLKFIDDRRRLPQIAAEVLTRPVFILGLPRAGSTFLHSLLAQDPDNRHPQTWEMMFPSPPPEVVTYGSDPRIERTQELLRSIGLTNPDVVALHPFDARLPEECHHLMELMGLGDSLPGVWRMPHFNKVRAGVDLREGYVTHRMALQNLQHRHRGKRWVLKNPGHLFHLEHLLAVYPDALIIQTHRDPGKVIPSVAALLVAMRRANSDATISAESIARGNACAFASGLETAIEFRRRPGVEAHFHDVHFRSLMNDPLGIVRNIYRRFGFDLSPATEGRMREWLADTARHAAGSRFTLAQFGLDRQQVAQLFGHYMSHYGIVSEKDAA